MDIDTSLLREKFIINESNADSNGKRLDLSCPSTRMSITLQTGEIAEETYVVRTHNMHSCIRMVSNIINNYERHGPLLNRSVKIKWDELWQHCINSYERKYNNGGWVAVYHKGNTIFSQNDYHQFFDVIEKCDVLNNGNYEASIKIAEDSFAKAGKDINISYNGNIALVAVLNEYEGRCSMILRGAMGTATFNYALKPKTIGQKLSISQGLSSTSDFLEGAHLSFIIGANNEKINNGTIEKYSAEYRQTQKAKERVNKLYAQINSMENRYDVRYRPERPDFDTIIAASEKLAQDNMK